MIKKSIILDTDMSPDSWAAVIFLASHPQIDLLAVSISGTGESHGEIGARNAARLLALARKKNVRVGFGQPTPLKGSEHFPGFMRWVMDRLLFIKLPKLLEYPEFEDSEEMIASILRACPQPVTIAAVGPQTNLANVLTKFPDLRKHIESITIMGGAVDVPGNIHDVGFWIKNDVAEWNFFCDPLAAKTVFESGVPVRLVPLDVTNQVPVTKAFVEEFSRQAKTPAANFILQMLRRIVGKFRRKVDFFLWDPMTCAAAVDPSICKFIEIKLDVVIKAGPKWASIEKTEEGSKVFVVKKIDKRRFENIFIDVICKSKISR